MARPRTRRRDDRVERKPKKRVSILDSEQITYVDYKDVNLLRRFMSERAKIRARRVTGNDTQQQREIARAIRVAREMALLPYSVRQVTHRSKGRRGERGERERELGANEVTGDAPKTDGAEGMEDLDVMVEADELGDAEGTRNGDDALVIEGDDGPRGDGEDDE
jgi:small subunit ribosomal protein S18